MERKIYKAFAAAIVIAWCAAANGTDLPRTDDYNYDVPEPGRYTLPIIKAAADGACMSSQRVASRC